MLIEERCDLIFCKNYNQIGRFYSLSKGIKREKAKGAYNSMND